jgi:hypothetical protein
MKPLLLILFLSIFFTAHAQGNDFFLLKKQSRKTLKHYYRGSYISFITKDKESYAGYIKKIAKDSVWIEYKQVLTNMTAIGSVITDTITYEARRFAVKDLSYIEKDKKGFEEAGLSVLLKLGGAGYILLHTINGLIRKDKISARNVGIAAGAYLAGVLLNKLRKDYYYIGKRFRIHYISLSANTAS